MISEALCNEFGCSNAMTTYGEGYCEAHRRNKCIMKECLNSQVFDGCLLCIVCLQSQKEILKDVYQEDGNRSNKCIMTGCLNSRQFEESDLCMVCSQSKKKIERDATTKVFMQPGQVPFQHCENPNGVITRESYNVQNMLHDSSGSNNNNYPEGMNLNTVSDECNDTYQKCLTGQENHSADMSDDTKPSLICSDLEPSTGVVQDLRSAPIAPAVVQDVRSAPQSHYDSYDFRIMAMNLPPIPSVPNPGVLINNSKQEEIITGGTVGNKTFGNSSINIGNMPFDSLPPIPSPFQRSSSYPESRNNICSSPYCKEKDCRYQAVSDLGGYCFNCFTANNSFGSSISSYKRNKLLAVQKPFQSLPSCNPASSAKSNIENRMNLNSNKEICKVQGCNFFTNEGFGGYCSECFMCRNISVNAPPSSNNLVGAGGFMNGASTFEKQLCRGKNCEFFGSDFMDGYCSQCYKPEVGKKDFDSKTLFDDYDDDERLCIICLQTPYNTVLLPCGHLYLCFECATSIKRKGSKCPACRSNIQSYHRVYTPD